MLKGKTVINALMYLFVIHIIFLSTLFGWVINNLNLIHIIRFSISRLSLLVSALLG